MAYGIKEQECRLDLSKKHTGNYDIDVKTL